MKLSGYSQLIKRLFPINKNNYGYYEVILFLNGWKRVIIDDYIPVKKDTYEPIGSQSNKYKKCFYHMLLEKAWAKINKTYFNIQGGSPESALFVLTGFKGKITNLYDIINYDKNYKRNLVESIDEGIHIKGFLYSFISVDHSFSLLDIIKLNDSYIFKIRNPWGIIGTITLRESCPIPLKKFLTEINRDTHEYTIDTKLVIEKDLINKVYEIMDKDDGDNGIIYVSEKYIYDLFDGIFVNYNMFDCTVIESLIKTDNKMINKYFIFKMIVKEKSFLQLNLTDHIINNDGKINFNYYETDIKIFNFNNNDGQILYNNDKKIWIIEKGEYRVNWLYYNDEIPDEILFFIQFYGNVELKFLGISVNPNPDLKNDIYKIDYKQNKYKINEKLGELYNRKSKMINFISKVLKKNIILDEQEEKGYSLDYREDNNICFSTVINREDTEDIFFVSKFLDIPEITLVGNDAFNRRIVNKGFIYKDNELVFEGNINYNLFPYYLKETDKNKLILEVCSKRYALSKEISENEIININIKQLGPFEGQKLDKEHSHYLTLNLRYNNNLGWNCFHCKNHYSYNKSYYCSLCEFDVCIKCKDYLINPLLKKNKYIYKGSFPTNKEEKISFRYSDFHIESLQHQHLLIKTKPIFPEGLLFKCYSCLNNIPNDKEVYYCTKCDFRLCERCKIIEKRGEKWQFFTCWHEHPLTFCNTKNIIFNFQSSSLCIKGRNNNFYSSFFFKCNHCGIENRRIKDCFYCSACDFYICMQCYKDYFFFKGRNQKNKVNVFMGNTEVYPTLVRCYIGDGKTKEDYCKGEKCRERLLLSERTYYCTNCNSNFCKNCYMFHKIIFKEDILIFDGNFSNKNKKNGFGHCYKKNNELNYSGIWSNGEFNLIKDIPHKDGFIKENLIDGSICDYCNKICSYCDTGIYCDNCQINICDNCLIEINKKLNSGQIHNHKLYIEKYNNKKKCTICKQLKDLLFECKECNKKNSFLLIFEKNPENPFSCCIDCFKAIIYYSNSFLPFKFHSV